MANQIRGKYHTVTVTPTVFAGTNVAGDVTFLPTEIPNACYPGGTSLLKTIRVFDKADLGVDISLLFFETKPTVEALGVAAALFTLAGGNNTDALVQAANRLGSVTIDVDGDSTTALNHTDNRTYIQSGIDMFSTSNPSQSHIDAETGVPGSIYVMGIAVGTPTTTVDSYTFQFIFEVY